MLQISGSPAGTLLLYVDIRVQPGHHPSATSRACQTYVHRHPGHAAARAAIGDFTALYAALQPRARIYLQHRLGRVWHSRTSNEMLIGMRSISGVLLVCPTYVRNWGRCCFMWISVPSRAN